MKKDKKNYSTIISDFLTIVRIAEQNYKVYEDLLANEDKLTQDILHTLELEDINYNEKAKLATKLKTNRKDRRYYKDVFMIIEELVKWKQEYKQSYEMLKQLLGRVRKIEQYQKERNYYPRTVEKLDDLFEKEGVCNERSK